MARTPIGALRSILRPAGDGCSGTKPRAFPGPFSETATHRTTRGRALGCLKGFSAFQLFDVPGPTRARPRMPCIGRRSLCDGDEFYLQGTSHAKLASAARLKPLSSLAQTTIQRDVVMILIVVVVIVIRVPTKVPSAECEASASDKDQWEGSRAGCTKAACRSLCVERQGNGSPVRPLAADDPTSQALSCGIDI